MGLQLLDGMQDVITKQLSKRISKHTESKMQKKSYQHREYVISSSMNDKNY